MSRQKELLNKILDHTATLSEKRELSRLLGYPNRWNQDFSEEWDKADGAIRKSLDRRIWNNIRSQISIKREFSMKFLFQCAACVAVLVLSFAMYQLWQTNHLLTRYADATISVNKGQKSDITLPDGSVVTVNSDSRVSYGKNFNGKKRMVELVGEAFFNVAKDPSAPFYVKVGNLTIQAVGTAFNVHAYPSEKEVVIYLDRGSVKLKAPYEAMNMQAGDVVHYSLTTHEMNKNRITNRNQYMSWMDDEMYLENKTLEEIIAILERHYNVQFVIKNEKIKKCTFSGTLKNMSLQSTLDVLSLSASIRYKRIGNIIELDE
jgi:transmembrane sensor